MGTFLSTFLSDSAELPELADRVRSAGPVPFSSPLPVAGLAADSIAATKLMASLLHLVREGVRDPTSNEVPQVSIAPQLVAGAYRSDQLFRWNGNLVPAWAPLSGFFASSDGWVRTHANYPHHEAALRSLLRLEGSASAEAVAVAISRRNALDLEDEAADSGAVISAVRSPSSWRAHPQAQILETEPFISLERQHGEPGLYGLGSAAGHAPLQGVRVLDLTRVIAGPVATRSLAFFGADVLRIDNPDTPELPWLSLDTGQGKRSALLNLDDKPDRDCLEQLLTNADVIVTGYRANSLDRFGLSPVELHDRHPGLVIGRVSAWGLKGPWAERRGFDSIVQAASGIAQIHADGTGRPGALPVQALDHSAGYLLAAGIMSALRRRHLDGHGWTVNISLARVAQELLTVAPNSQVPAVGTYEIETVTAETLGGTVTCAAPAIGISGGTDQYRWIGRPWGTDQPEWAEPRSSDVRQETEETEETEEIASGIREN
ncbi:CoA transferase [Alpinimonas psychrophila]|uniref:Crotonobetainyl-CoA:carnitine CoA-transferase CaiB-like acyl-CoA transferase n=1 Tax=Alpinimonas psychrophila TaxID=748908 RepID=A0A7W3JUE8_9MICO|nr:CoA transferase [Alpinimonas psychrophila]MBA8829449.1 crotonobetainyl-CoA:carnitine CoA-transferase CaiB-like acyl-CoA transferase [Alpinimonas psychrophila]